MLYLNHSTTRVLKMNEDILASFNWLDLLMIIVMIGVVFRGTVQGFVVELFRMIGTVFATVVVLHYYVRGAESLTGLAPLPEKIAEIFCFILIWVSTILIFKLIREGWLLVLKSEAKSGFSQWLGGFVAVVRCAFICGLLFFFIFLVGNRTLNIFAKKSVTGFYLLDLSPRVYKAAYDGILIKFFPEEAFNEKALETIKKASISRN